MQLARNWKGGRRTPLFNKMLTASTLMIQLKQRPPRSRRLRPKKQTTKPRRSSQTIETKRLRLPKKLPKQQLLPLLKQKRKAQRRCGSLLRMPMQKRRSCRTRRGSWFHPMRLQRTLLLLRLRPMTRLGHLRRR